MIREEPELLTDIRDFTTLFYMIFRRKSSKWSESSIESDLGMRFAIWSVDFAIRNFTFFKHCFGVVIRENEIFISVIRDPLPFSVREPCQRPPLYDPLNRFSEEI